METSNLMLNEPIKLFLDMCLWEKGIKESDAKVRADMIKELAGDFEEFLLQAIFSEMDPKHLPDWKELMSGEPTPETVMDFFKNKLPNFESLLEKTMGEFKRVYVGA